MNYKRSPPPTARAQDQLREDELGDVSRSPPPAMVAGLPQDLRRRVRLLVLLGPSPHVVFEFHVSDWLRDAGKGAPVKPDIDKLHGMNLLSLSGQDDKDALCPALANMPAIAVV